MYVFAFILAFQRGIPTKILPVFFETLIKYISIKNVDKFTATPVTIV